MRFPSRFKAWGEVFACYGMGGGCPSFRPQAPNMGSAVGAPFRGVLSCCRGLARVGGCVLALPGRCESGWIWRKGCFLALGPMCVPPWLVQACAFLVREWFGVRTALTPVERRRRGASRVGCRRGAALGRQAEVGRASINEAGPSSRDESARECAMWVGWVIGCDAGAPALTGEYLDAIIDAS